MAWRVAKALEKFRDQINAAAPNRDKGSDGTIGDEAHASTSSDHNPHVKDGSMGIVTAMDITHDPEHGVNTYKIAEQLRLSKDKRIKFVISDGRIFGDEAYARRNHTVAWAWGEYNGRNPHSHHIHVSVNPSKAEYDSMVSWKIGGLSYESETDKPEKPKRLVLRRGASGDDVKHLQTLIGVTPDGEFGPLTEAAVRAFQQKKSIVVDGIVGPHTWSLLEA